MSETTMIHVRVDEALKERAIATLAEMGLTLSDAVRVLLSRIVHEKAFPFPIAIPNEDERFGSFRFETADDMFDALNKAAETAKRVRPARRWTLDEMLAQCDPTVPFTDEDRAWSNMKPVGREI